MASLNAFINNITGTTGAANTIEPKAGWKVYLLPRGAHASAASAASPITFDSDAAAARFNANDWFQVGTDISRIRRVSAVGGNSFAYAGLAITVAQNERVLRIGTTQPVVSNTATYIPHTTTYPRDDDGSTPTGSSTITDSNGFYAFYAADAIYDLLVQDANGTNVGLVADIQIGHQVVTDLTPVDPGGASLGTCSLPFANLRFVGMLDSGITSASGRTAFKFDTCNAITAGNLFSFGNTGSVKVYGDSHGGIFHSWSLPEVINVKSAKYGAKGDGSTDDTAAITAAIADAIAISGDADGQVVFFPPGVYMISSTITLTNRVRLLGSGIWITVLRATTGFSFNGTTTAMVRIGTGAGVDSYGSIEYMTIDANDVANSICVRLNNAQERTGPRNCALSRYRIAGINSAGSFANQNLSIDRCGFAPSASGSVAQGISLTDTSGTVRISSCSFVPYDGATHQLGPAIALSGTNTILERIHIENHTTGLSAGSGTVGAIIGLDVGNSVPTVLNVLNGWQVFNCGGTITHAGPGTVHADNSGNWAMMSLDGPTVSTRSRFFSGSGVLSYLNSPTVFANTLTTNGAFGVTGNARFGGSVVEDMDSVTLSSTTLSAASRRSIILANGAGQNTVTTLSNGITGQLLELISTGGTWSVTDGDTIHTAGAFTATNGDTIEFRCIDGVSWFERHRSVN